MWAPFTHMGVYSVGAGSHTWGCIVWGAVTHLVVYSVGLIEHVEVLGLITHKGVYCAGVDHAHGSKYHGVSLRTWGHIALDLITHKVVYNMRLGHAHAGL